jgi:excisionase family DNA binding protein
MAEAVVFDVGELPVVLKVRHIQETLGISRQESYRLVHMAGFPVMRIGRSIRVPQDAFLRWLEQQANVEKER